MIIVRKFVYTKFNSTIFMKDEEGIKVIDATAQFNFYYPSEFLKFARRLIKDCKIYYLTDLKSSTPSYFVASKYNLKDFVEKSVYKYQYQLEYNPLTKVEGLEFFDKDDLTTFIEYFPYELLK